MEPPEPVDAYGDTEHLLVDYLASAIWPPDVGEVRAAVALPHDWTPRVGYSVVQVAVDSSVHHAAWGGHSLAQDVLVRLTAWPAAAEGTNLPSPTRAKRLCRLAESVLMAWPGRPVSGVVSTDDAPSGVPIATCTVTVGRAPTN
ncbi:MAG TPA: hypothetical protein K8V84_22945 [Nocardiopsis listeri]|uniref:hypothetical protein n=1 Tax=Nocardiopsis listeri TaxID=53440 RepID=UPI001D1FB10A|nr:hypothetical protein [Nocardiopsis listeri]HJE61339.1 hypothetical protein [Nocardiopsis listeri]